MANRTYNKTLKCILTQEEQLACGEEMANAQAKVAALTDEMSSVKKQIGSKIEEQNNTISRNADMIRTGHEYRQVKCEEELLIEEGVAVTHRLDTGEEIERRLLTEDEKQVDMFDGEEESTVTQEPDTETEYEGEEQPETEEAE